MEHTVYGYKQTGNSRFVIVAPHAAGDDRKTGLIARRIAAHLDASLIVNTKFFKKTNSRATNFPERIEDFNRLTWGYTKQRYLWSMKKPEMKDFFTDVRHISRTIITDQKIKPVVVYIHGMRSKIIGIDVGAGLQQKKNIDRLIGCRYYKNAPLNTGLITTNITNIKRLRNELHKHLLSAHNLIATVGAHYSGWSKHSAIQYHKHGKRNHHALQLEISHVLRTKLTSRYTASLIASALKKTFATI